MCFNKTIISQERLLQKYLAEDDDESSKASILDDWKSRDLMDEGVVSTGNTSPSNEKRRTNPKDENEMRFSKDAIPFGSISKNDAPLNTIHELKEEDQDLIQSQ